MAPRQQTAYRNAFRCRRCPERNDADGCPAWVEYVETSPATSEQRATRGCLFQALPKFLIHTLAAAGALALPIEAAALPAPGDAPAHLPGQSRPEADESELDV